MKREPGFGALLAIVTGLSALFVGGLGWVRVTRERVGVDERTRARLAR